MKKKNILIFVLLFFCITLVGCEKKVPLKESMKLSFLVCGDADITLIQYGSHFVLIDTGEDTCEDKVLSYLKKEKVKEIDLLILTHPDKDHIGNATAIMKNRNVKKVLSSTYQKGSNIESEMLSYIEEKNIDLEKITTPKTIKIEELQFKIEPPRQVYDSSNNSSLLVFLTSGDIKTFFGADIKKKRIEELLNQSLSKVNLVKLPYHGRYISNLEPLLKKLNPEMVIITATKVEEKTKQLLEQLKIDYQITTEDIIIETDGMVWRRI